ncbi:MAG: hypothetical protein ACUVSY_13520, partial [Roseiflexus sp.]
ITRQKGWLRTLRQIIVRDFSYRYPPATQWILRRLNLSIDAGEYVLLCGACGSECRDGQCGCCTADDAGANGGGRGCTADIGGCDGNDAGSGVQCVSRRLG